MFCAFVLRVEKRNFYKSQMSQNHNATVDSKTEGKRKEKARKKDEQNKLLMVN